MTDPAPWRSPLAGLGRDRFETPGGAVLLEDRSELAKIVLHGKPEDQAFLAAARQALDLDLPLVPNSAAEGEGVAALWTGPREWLLVAPRDGGAALLDALAGLAAVEVTEGRAAIRLSGGRALDLLRKGTSLDVHPRSFAPGACAQTRLAQCALLIHRPGDGATYDLYCERSFAEYLWLWLEDAALEFGGT